MEDDLVVVLIPQNAKEEENIRRETEVIAVSATEATRKSESVSG